MGSGASRPPRDASEEDGIFNEQSSKIVRHRLNDNAVKALELNAQSSKGEPLSIQELQSKKSTKITAPIDRKTSEDVTGEQSSKSVHKKTPKEEDKEKARETVTESKDADPSSQAPKESSKTPAPDAGKDKDKKPTDSKTNNKDDSTKESSKIPMAERPEKEQQAAAADILKVQLSLFPKTKDVWKSKDLESKDLLDHVKNLRKSYSAFSAMCYTVKNDHRSKLYNPFISSGSLDIVCDIVTMCLEKDAYFTKDSQGQRAKVEVQAELLKECLSILCSFTDTSPKIRDAVVKHGKVVPAVVKKLDDWHQPHMDGSRLDIEDKYVNKGLTAVYMISAENEKSHMDYIRQIDGFFAIFQKYLKSKNDDNRLTAIATLANVAKEAEAKDITAEKGIIHFLLDQFKQTFTSKSHSSSAGWTMVGLCKVVKMLAQNDANKQLLVKEGALPLLLDGMNPQHQKAKTSQEKRWCLESLWWLSFDAVNREEIMKQDQLLETVVAVYKAGPGGPKDKQQKEMYVPAEGILFQLRDNLRQKDKYKDIANKLLGEKSKSHVQADSVGHVMMSYQTQHRPVVKKVCDFLGKNGLKMWMDIYDMREGEESTLQTMAEAVEGSAVVLMCVSETYKNSPYCRAEAEYAFMKQKHIIPLKLQKGYVADGWLGIVQGSKFFYDFTRDERDQQTRMQQLLAAVKKAMGGGTQGEAANKQGDKVDSAPLSHNTDSHTPQRAPSVEKVKTWTKKDVQAWLTKYKLKGDKMEALTSDEILYLYNLKEEAPELFHTMLRTDLGLTGLSDMSSFNKAITALPTEADDSSV